MFLYSSHSFFSLPRYRRRVSNIAKVKTSKVMDCALTSESLRRHEQNEEYPPLAWQRKTRVYMQHAF